MSGCMALVYFCAKRKQKHRRGLRRPHAPTSDAFCCQVGRWPPVQRLSYREVADRVAVLRWRAGVFFARIGCGNQARQQQPYQIQEAKPQ